MILCISIKVMKQRRVQVSKKMPLATPHDLKEVQQRAR